MLQAALLYMLGVNVAAFAAFAIDKHRAQRGLYRVSERDLIWLAAIGGSAGAIAAQQILRHKTRKEPFRTLLWLIPVAQAIALAALYFVVPLR